MNRLYLFICFLGITLSASAQQTSLERQIQSIIKGKDATVGVAVLYDGKELTTVNDQCQYPMQSVYKLHLAMATLDYLDKNKLSTDTKIAVKKEDLKSDTYSPFRDKYPEGKANVSVGELLKYTVSQSDNNTCDILFDYVGGPEVVEAYIKGLGIEQVAISCNEDAMHQDYDAQYSNWTTPSEAVKLLEMVKSKNLFSAENSTFLKRILVETKTGPDKIVRLLPDDVVVGHKTGSSDRNAEGVKGADNDIAFVKLPDSSSYTLAIFIKDSKEDDKTNAQIIARISRIVFENYLLRSM